VGEGGGGGVGGKRRGGGQKKVGAGVHNTTKRGPMVKGKDGKM